MAGEAQLQKLLTTMLHRSSATTNLMVETIHSLLNSVNARDSYTYQHSINVGFYAWKIANQFQLDEEECVNIYIGGLLHDIGKIGTPDSILLKDRKLTKEEFDMMKKHTETGYAIVQVITPFHERGIDKMVLYHHERMDGKGYPEGLYSSDIPLGAKIVSVADAFDAMTTVRHYRPSLDHGKAVDQLLRGKGTQFDPIVLDMFLEAMSSQIVKDGV
jgi:putative nucleotidyltransferase with HDIG domain